VIRNIARPRSTPAKVVLNLVTGSAILGLTLLAARRFASIGWPLEGANPRLVALAGVLFLLSFAFKASGWQRLFAPRERPRRAALAAAAGAGSVSGAALPPRLDDVVRVLVVRRYPGCPAGVGTLALSLAMLGLVDTAALTPLSVAAAATSTGAPEVRAGLAVVAFAGFGAVLVMAALPRLVASGRLIRFRTVHWFKLHAASPKEAWSAWLLVLSSWATRAVGLFVLLAALDVSVSSHLSFPLALGFLCAAAASSALPIAPAGAATQAGAGAALLVASGVDVGEAVAFAVSAQALLILVGASVIVLAAGWHVLQRVATQDRHA
jgi:uncharacterized membrane protein YbhN (UPF0104 family)